MKNDDRIPLNNADPEDIDDALGKIEKSFGIKFHGGELNDVKTLGALCDIITSRIQGTDIPDCTSQQAFYKIRDAISVVTLFDRNSITPETRLDELFPRDNRPKQITLLQKELKMRVPVLRAKNWLTLALVWGTVISVFTLWLHWQSGVAGLLFFSSARLISDKYFAKELTIKSVRELTELIVRDNYKKARRNPDSFNRLETEKIVKAIFATNASLDEQVLLREATF